MSTILHRREMHVAISTDEAAKELIDASQDIQAAFFLGMVTAIENWPRLIKGGVPCWPMQCRGIADEMDPQQRSAVASMLDTLIEHLREVRDCSACEGEGRVIDTSGNFPDKPGVNAGPFIEYMECPACNGTKVE
jgi:hypothetical protein